MFWQEHGQPASPYRLGRKFEVFAVVLEGANLILLNDIPSAAKLWAAPQGKRTIMPIK